MHPFMKQISMTHSCAVLYREKALGDLGLSGCHPPYLLALYRTPGVSQEELSRRLNVNKYTVARQLAALESAGYVRREPSPEDRRATLVYPTAQALAVEERIREANRAWAAYLTGDLTAEEQETLSRLMQRIARRAEDYVKGGGRPCGSSADT